MEIRKMLVDPSKYGIKCPYAMNAKFIVVHNTANDASAKNEISYMIRNAYDTSFHFAVDDQEVVQGIPLDRNSWHAGDGANGNGNRNGISIEICYSKSGGDKFIKAEKNAVKLIAQLLKERGWGINKVMKHQDFSNKYCPHRTLDMGWQRFLDMIGAELNQEEKPSTNVEPYTGYVEVIYGGADGLDVHSTPTFEGNVAAVAKKGDVFTVVGRVKVDGVYMYKIKSGLYITSAKEYVSYRTTLHGSASNPAPALTPIQLEAAANNMKVAIDLPNGSHFWISENSTVYGGAA